MLMKKTTIKKPTIPVLCLMLTIFGSSVAAADIEKARLLYDARLLEDSKRELVGIATSDAPKEEKATALHLLGTIAVDEKRYDAALRTWKNLVSEYPDSKDAHLVTDKIPLVQALVDQAGSGVTSIPAAAPEKVDLSGVIVTATGPSPQLTDLAVDEISNFLIGNGVPASKAPSGRASLAELKPMASDSSASSFLVLTMKFGYLESLRAECYSVDGNLLWKEKVSGSFGFGKARIAAGLIERIKRKLEDHLGDSCLPIGN